MKFEEITTKLDVKEALIMLLTENKDRQTLIAISQELFQEFANKDEVRENLYTEEKNKIANREYFIFDDKKKGVRNLVGKAAFQFLGGIWILKKFTGFNCQYPKSFSDEAELMIFLVR